MTETMGSSGSGHPNLNLSPEEKRVYGQLLKEADPDGFGAVSGDVAVKFFERTKLQPDVLGQIWQIADVENRGFLTPAGFGVVLRLIGHAQAGGTPTAALATQPAPLPRFDTISAPTPAQSTPVSLPPQATGPPASPSVPGGAPIRVPALTPDKVATYSSLFEKSGAENGFLSGLLAKQIFERAGLPNDVLGKIWALSDTQGRGALDMTEFVIAMHLLASHKSGQLRAIPNTLPPGLYEAAQRRVPVRAGSGSRPGSSAIPNIPPQFSGSFHQRPQSPITRQPIATPLSNQSTGEAWLVSPADKARFDSIFATVDRSGRGFITGDQAVEFFGNARLPEEVLAQIWDLADINSEGQLSKDEFAVAMYLIRQQRGTRDGRGVLPSTLPPALIPPSMRKHTIPPPQPTAPAFENATVTKPRSAADDLFGLDAFGPPPTAAPQQVAQSTGGTDAGPFANPPSLPTTISPQTTSTNFKPFIPTSSFGQSIIPQSTGSPAPNQTRSPPPTDDLLGDADPEVSSKLTSETSELGNLSNQVSTLSKQMTELHGTRKRTSQDLSNTSSQKRAFEGRLAQLRALYEKEVKEVKTLQEQLSASKNDTTRLQQEIAMVESTRQDLVAQHQQVRAALEADQRENASLKERIRLSNQESEQLKPQLEKLKSDARQQKGLVAINRKQLATNEAERDRIRAEIAAAHQQVEDALREAEESARELEDSKRELEEAQNVPVPTVKDPSPVASPAPSTTSNPFFRRTTETSFSPPIGSPEPRDNQTTFDSIFGPSFAAGAGAAPPVSFSSQSSPPGEAPEIPSVPSPSSSTPTGVVEPPPPPQSKQITSAALPFRQPLGREDSISSSVRVAQPVSRLSPADTPRALTPTTGTSSPHTQREFGDDPFSTAAAPDEEQESVKRSLPQASTPKESVENAFGNPSASLSGIPGAFPEGSRSETPATAGSTGAIAAGAGLATVAAAAGAAALASNGDVKAEGKGKDPESTFDDVFGGPAHQRSASQQAADFDSAFAGFNKPAVANGTTSAANKEFPDIQEFGGDDDESDSDYSDEHMKFDDDFNTRSPPKDTAGVSKDAGKQPEAPAAVAALRPPLDSTASAASSLPGIDQQKSPPTYGEAVPEENPSHFPREFQGLLPEREDPTSPHDGAEDALAGTTSPSYGPEAHARKPSESSASVPPPTKAAPFDFDSAFAEVGAAPVADDDDESDEDLFSPKQNTADFDPTFDSPSQPQAANTVYSSVTNGTAAASGTTQPSASHDWDSLFAPLDSKADNVAPTDGLPNVISPGPSSTSGPAPNVAVSAATTGAPNTSPPAASPPPANNTKLDRPQAGRALSTGTEHDDPILKRLTAMGWTREESLSALERFDYNIDKAADYLTFKS
ncbi:hypothetical protein PV10_06405 [Exophiala mesophila]|uniref:Actin cytoskeleton-regulatory complex protein END3 n=1 Tax=Exophiala mesophila TaxID=212818 RepID=A0A0D1ZDA8_EXOME|nr:uncharacterized protein PV10_06405 [Exophiala mesophila]KIV91914.1 hypothetical protein PV10_06405 [Exophiala mesophila]